MSTIEGIGVVLDFTERSSSAAIRERSSGKSVTMRITIVSETYFPQVNGVSRTLSQLARVLRETGDDVQLIHPNYGAEAESEQDNLVPSVRVPFYREVHLPVPPYRGVRKAIRSFRPDLIHIATEASLGFAVLKFASAMGTPVVSSFHTNFDQYSSHYRIGWARGIIWRYLRWFHNQTIETYVPSQTTIKDLESRGFERLVLWPRGVDGGLFRPNRPQRSEIRKRLGVNSDDVLLAYVGRLAAEKNTEFLAEALGIAAAAAPRVRIVIVGDGPARSTLEAKLQGVATFVGFRSGDELADLYSAADLFAFASLTETFGNVVLEAMASGLPPVILGAGGPSEIVRDQETGTVLPPDASPHDFAQALLTFVHNDEHRKQISIKARLDANERTWERIMGSLRARYQSVIDSNKHQCVTPDPEVSVRPLQTHSNSLGGPRDLGRPEQSQPTGMVDSEP